MLCHVISSHSEERSDEESGGVRYCRLQILPCGRNDTAHFYLDRILWTKVGMQKWETAESNLVNEEEANLENRRPEFEQGPLDAMDAFVAALNALDDEALYHTIHLPHFRISADGVLIYPALDELKKSYLQDFFARAGTDWGHTIFDSKDVIHSSENKAHVFLQFTRYDSSGSNIVTFRSLWIMTRVDGKWGVQARSSFAP